MKNYYPEGTLFENRQNKKYMESVAGLRECFFSERILEARATMCDRDHNLYVDLGAIQGVIPRDECAIGISEGEVRDIAIISRVNKPVSFKIIDFSDDENGVRTAILSRKQVQQECIDNYINNLRAGDIITAKITHNESFGSFCDIGCGICALLPIDSISVSRIPHPDVRFPVNTTIKAVVKSRDALGRITLTHKELLGTWQENADNFRAGQTVGGVVRSIEKYGVFIELTPNLAGLAEYTDSVQVGDMASVYIKSINPEKMKIKLSIVDSFPEKHRYEPLQYYCNDNHIDVWQYSPECAEKHIESMFSIL